MTRHQRVQRTVRQLFLFLCPGYRRRRAGPTTLFTTSTLRLNAWLNTYAVSAITGGDNKWFVNRLKLGIWQNPPSKTTTTRLQPYVAQRRLLDRQACTSNSYPVKACFKGTWSVVGNTANGLKVLTCATTPPTASLLYRTPDELEALITAMGANQKFGST